MLRISLLAAVLAVLLLPPAGRAVDSSDARPPSASLHHMRRIPIQHGGRIKPFSAFSLQQVELITGKARFGGKEPTAAVLELLKRREQAAEAPIVKVEYQPLRQALRLPLDRQHFSLRELEHGAAELQRLVQTAQAKRERQAGLDPLEQKAELVVNRMLALRALLSGEAIAVVPEDPIWRSPYHDPDSSAHAWFALVNAYGGEGDFAALSAAWHAQAAALSGQRLTDLEAHYWEVRPFRLAWMAYLAAFILLCFKGGFLDEKSRLGLLAAGFAFLVHSYGLVLRMLILQRPPVANMYESMIFMNWCLVLIALVFARAKHELAVLRAACLVSALIMIYSSLLPLDSSLDVLVPVLRSNYWLTLHVLVIVASYGAFGLAAALGHRHFFLTSEARAASDHLMYRILQFGVLLLGIGTVLGGVWANESWGRFWGWDPKETWALITFIGYLIVLHLRHFRRIKADGLAAASIVCFLLVLMTWYGVNFILGQGLHSYGSGSGGMFWIWLYLGGELLFGSYVVLFCIPAKR